MFEDAAKLHYAALGHVGGGSRHVKGELYGKGCWLSEKHILTARHIWLGLKDSFEWPVAIRHDGLWKCEIVFEQANADLLLMKTVTKLDNAELSQPNRYPGISANRPFLGRTVGYLASLNVPEGDKENKHTYFSMSCISMFLPNSSVKAVHYALTGGLIQKGFSGGPVFEENGDMLGILIQSLRFPVDPENPILSFATMPIMSAVFPF